MNKNKYLNFLNFFVNKGYKYVAYKNYNSKKCIILRHDIDFNLEYAFELAKLNYKNKIISHFFFIPNCVHYNLFEEKNLKIIDNIINMGHIVGLHYNDSKILNFDQQFALLKKANKKISNIYSIHKFGSNKIHINKINYINFYSQKYMIKYFADSGGSFRFGSPKNEKEMLNGKISFQLNLHPIWWVNNTNKHKIIVKNIIKLKTKKILEDINNYKLIKII